MVGTKRKEQKEQTRLKIMDTAFHLYSLNGFSTATNVIAQEAGISHGAIFAHFKAKEELQLQVLKRFAGEVGGKLHNLAAFDGNITELLHGHIRVLEKYEPFYKNVLKELSSLPEETKTLMISLQSIISSHFAIAIERGQREGMIKDIPLHMMFNTWLGLLHYYLQNSELFAPGSSVLGRCGNEIVNTFVILISK